MEAIILCGGSKKGVGVGAIGEELKEEALLGSLGVRRCAWGFLRTVGPGIPGRNAMMTKASALSVEAQVKTACGLSPQHPDLLLWVTAGLQGG